MSETLLSKTKAGVEVAKKYLKKRPRGGRKLELPQNTPKRSSKGTSKSNSKARSRMGSQNKQKSAYRSSPLNDLKVEIDWVNTDRRLGNKPNNKKKFFLTKTGNPEETKELLQMNEIAAFKSHFKERDNMESQRVDKVVYDSKNFKVVRKVKGGSEEEERSGKKVDSISTVKFLSSRIQKEFYMSVEIKRLVKKFKTKQLKQQERCGSYVNMGLMFGVSRDGF